MTPFDPYSHEAIIESIKLKFESQPMYALTDIPRFTGSGIYAIYYRGKDTSLYRSSIRIPLYVGKADYEGSRRGILDIETLNESTKLYTRLLDHARSLTHAQNLNIGDFRCRFLRVSPQHTYTAEVTLVSTYQPVWNQVLDGFGRKSTKAGETCTKWDTLHPGRPQGLGTTENLLPVDELEAMVITHQKTRQTISASEIAEVLSAA